MNEKQQQFVDMMANDTEVIAAIADIEKSPATTRNHYGNYMSLLSSLSNGNKVISTLLGSAFVKAGANAQGIDDALKFI